MRLWSLHPSLLDRSGLGGLWKEGLLAQAVIGTDRGYSGHSQLLRFMSAFERMKNLKDRFGRDAPDSPQEIISTYLRPVFVESRRRGYRYNESKIMHPAYPGIKIPVTVGQIRFEFEHLKRKLEIRDPDKFEMLQRIDFPQVHPMFVPVPGQVEYWEKAKNEFESIGS